VFGAGPIGLMAIQILNVCGAARVIAVGVFDYRLSIAEKYGAIPLNPTKVDVAAEVKKITSARQGADIVLEMTGSPKVYPTMFEILRNEGRIVTVGHPGEDVPINVTQWINLKGASIKGVFGRRIWVEARFAR
jgi:threonine 3-dehydrogenase